MNEHGLNERQLRFADLYLELGNASEAYRQAGYECKNKRTVETASSRLLRNVRVKAYINGMLSKMSEKRVASAEEVLAYLTSVMEGKAVGSVVIGEGMGSQIIEDITPTVTERTKAAELLGKRHRLFTEQVDLNANVGVTIVDDVEDDE
ncbi:terminase small subunit [Bacillus cereus group sp. Bc252]|uniref:terminase small subunit n=1 Tax=Bacillus TaxID=1386 RepID=UPI0021CE95D9|nr:MULTISPECIES: terminase small subunit [Bacillus cereus group]MCU5206754.1 terminase small subunit [Bacillus paranthracis]MDA2160266.1 terminase small subunit [Bacillus cereus group sp. Bc252]HDR7786442.1 terminase small subunit [Bacillus paranthracis]